MKKYDILLSILMFFLLFLMGQKVTAEVDNSSTISSNFAISLENDINPANDFPDNWSTEQYLDWYTGKLNGNVQYPHLPKHLGGIATPAYESLEIDISTVDPSKISLVYNQTDLNNAINNANIQVISVMKSFVVSSLNNFTSSNRVIIIEGNNLLIDFSNALSQFTGSNIQMTIQNLNSYHGNYYGYFRPTGTNSVLRFHNLNDYGSQIISSQSLPVEISGDFQNRFTQTTYVSPINTSTSVSTSADNQQNFESSNLRFLGESNTILQTRNGINIEVFTSGSNIIFEENSTLNIIGANADSSFGEHGYGYPIVSRNTNNFMMKKNSKINYKYTDPGNGIRNNVGFIWFVGSNSQFSMEDGANIQINKDSYSYWSTSYRGIIEFQSTGTFNMSDKSSIEMNIGNITATGVPIGIDMQSSNSIFNLDNSNIIMNIEDDKNGFSAVKLANSQSKFNLTNGSKLIANLKNSGIGNNDPVINLGSYASFNINSGSELNITADGYKNQILNIGSGSSSTKTTFLVDENSLFFISSINRGQSNANNIVNVGNNASFKINPKGTFNLSADYAKYLFNIGSSSTFSFSNAQLVQFGFLQNPASTSALINMSGNFDIGIQRVQAWARSNEALNDDISTYDWTPLFSVKIPYSGTNVNKTGLLASSISPDIVDSFKENYNTGPTNGFQRLRFEYIPDVTVMISNQLVDNPSSINSRTVIGKTVPNAYIRLSDQVVLGGYSSFPVENNKIKSPVTSDNTDLQLTANFTTQADSNGDFTYTLPTGSQANFTAGNTINVFAFKNGKSATTSGIVKDTTPPNATIQSVYAVKGGEVPEVMDFIKTLKDTNPSLDNTLTARYVTSNEQLQQNLQQSGEYNVQLIVQDKAGNSQEYTGTLIVLEIDGEINGNNITLVESEIIDLSRTDFESKIKNMINATAYSIVNGQKQDLTNKISYDFSNVSQSPGNYLVNTKVLASDSPSGQELTKTFSVKVSASSVEMTIKQVYKSDPDAFIYSDYTIEKRAAIIVKQEAVGEKIPEIISQLLSETFKLNYPGYKEITINDYKIEVNNNLVSGNTVPNQDFTLIFEYEGELSVNAPNIDFGNIQIGKTLTPYSGSGSSSLEIINTALTANWTLSAAMPYGIIKMNTDTQGINIGGNSVFNGQLIYKKNGQNIILNREQQAIQIQEINDPYTTLSLSDPSTGQLNLDQYYGNFKGAYQGTIVWTLSDTIVPDAASNR